MGMYTVAGDQAVELVLSEYLNRAAPIKKSEVQDIIKQIQDRVIEMGKGRVHPAKYGDTWEGFNEVGDTAVRESLYMALMAKAIDD